LCGISALNFNMIKIHSEDNMCFPRLIVTAKAIVDDDPEREEIVRGDKKGKKKPVSPCDRPDDVWRHST